jgi:hypothetical protein
MGSATYFSVCWVTLAVVSLFCYQISSKWCNDEIKCINNLPNNDLETIAGEPDKHLGCLKVRKWELVETRKLADKGEN